jgi:PqqD family protein of HPr-rel-A system
MEAAMRLAKFVKFREESFGGVLFETRSEKVFTLNPTAAAVVREIQTGATEREIAERLKARYDNASDALEGEVSALIGELRSKGLVEDSA